MPHRGPLAEAGRLTERDLGRQAVSSVIVIATSRFEEPGGMTACGPNRSAALFESSQSVAIFLTSPVGVRR